MTDATDQANQQNHHWCVFWCCYLNRDDSRPWYESTNCGKATIGVLRWTGYFLILLLLLMGLFGFTWLISFTLQTAYGIPNCNGTDVKSWFDCSGVGALTVILMLLHMIATIPIILTIGYILSEFNRLFCQCMCGATLSRYVNVWWLVEWFRGSICNSPISLRISDIVYVIFWFCFSVFIAPYFDQIFYYSSPCNFAQYYTAQYDDNSCMFRNFSGSLFVDGIFLVIAFAAYCFFDYVEQWHQEVIDNQQNQIADIGQPTDQSTVELQIDTQTMTESDPQTNTMQIPQTQVAM